MANGGGLKVFFDLFSQPSRAVLLLLKVNKVPYEPMMLKLSQGKPLASSTRHVGGWWWVGGLIVH